jgi:hypothetical protein
MAKQWPDRQRKARTGPAFLSAPKILRHVSNFPFTILWKQQFCVRSCWPRADPQNRQEAKWLSPVKHFAREQPVRKRVRQWENCNLGDSLAQIQSIPFQEKR